MINALASQTFAAILENAPTGLVGTLGVRIDDTEGNTVAPRTTTGIVEVVAGSGTYAKSNLIAPDDPGSYIVIWDANDVFAPEELRVREAPEFAPWSPTVEEVAEHVSARTKTDDGVYVGTFNEDTRPTGEQVETLIANAVADVRAVFTADEVPESSWSFAKRAAELKAALFIELSYFPEQAQDNSPYLQLRALSDQAMKNLIARATALDMFGEDPLPDYPIPLDQDQDQ